MKNKHKIIGGIAIIAILAIVAYTMIAEERVVKDGDTIKVHYTGTLENGQQFDSSEGREPFRFTVGAGQVITGFDKAVIGMKVGEEKTVTLPPEEAYGNTNRHPLGGKTLIFKIRVVEIE